MARSKAGSNTARKLPRKKKVVPEGVPFKKGYDPRRNLKGRPKSFDQFRALAKDIAEQIATTASGTALKWNGQEITFAEFALLSWATDKKYLEKFIEVAYGKVPDKLEIDDKRKAYLVVSPDDWKKKPKEEPENEEDGADDRDSGSDSDS